MREYNYNIQYIKGKDNYVADHLSRPVRVVVRFPETTLLGFDQQRFRDSQREELVWRELAEYMQGGRIPTRRLPKNT